MCAHGVIVVPVRVNKDVELPAIIRYSCARVGCVNRIHMKLSRNVNISSAEIANEPFNAKADTGVGDAINDRNDVIS
jgi:hypothetical protein